MSYINDKALLLRLPYYTIPTKLYFYC